MPAPPDQAADFRCDPNTALAAERTLLAWIRTGLALMGLGFVVARFGLFLHEMAAVDHLPARASHGLSVWIGGALVVLGVLVLTVAGIQHVRLLRQLAQGRQVRLGTSVLGVLLAGFLAAVGVLMTVYLVVAAW